MNLILYIAHAIHVVFFQRIETLLLCASENFKKSAKRKNIFFIREKDIQEPIAEILLKQYIRERKHINLIPMITKIFYWLRLVGIAVFIMLLLALFYVKMFVN